jgi:hypothetical protein
MTGILNGAIGKIIKDAKRSVIDFNGLSDVSITDMESNAKNESMDVIKANILDIDKELRGRVNELTKLYGNRNDLQAILLKEIGKDFANKYSKGRIQTLATTETTKIYGKIAKETIKKNNKKSVWRHTGRGAKDRATHRAADGQEINGKRQAFFVGGEWVQYPGDGSPKNSVNCHCILVSE